MSLEFLPPTEIEKQRAAWFAERAKPGTAVGEYWRLNEEAFRLFPRTEEERRRKTESLLATPEFVL
jgi:TfoX/Sxy family transcriptional regulator of competence genes